MAAAAAACPGGASAGERPEQLGDAAGRRQALAPRFVYENTITASPKVYILQPWITNLLMNYERLDASENLLAGQVLRLMGNADHRWHKQDLLRRLVVLRDSTAPDQPGVLQHAVLQVSDGSYHIRAVITAEALQAEENAHMQLRLSSLVCRIIVLQKYTVCFQEEARLEDCEFYLTVQQFIVLPMERQRLESDDGNREPSVLQKIKELWLKSLALKNAPSSEPSISQLIDAIGQNQLEVLKENAEECLDLWVPKGTLVKDEVPITPWEAERKKEGEDIFMVPATTLVIPPEEGVVACQASTADMSEEPPGKSDDGGMMPSDLGIVSQSSSAESTAMLESSEESQDNPWNRLPPISLTLNSSDDKTQQDLSLKVQQDVMADSNTPDSLKLCSQDSPEGLSWEEPAQTPSPSLLCFYGTTSPVETGTAQAPTATEAACAAPSPQVSEDSWTTPPPSLSPVLPILPSSRLQSLPEGMPHREQEGMPHREQADSSGTAFPPDPLKHGPAPARTQGGDVSAKRKLLARDGQWHPPGAEQGRESDANGSMQGAKKSRKEEMGLRCGKEPSEEEEKEEEQASSESGPSSRPQQRRVLEPYVPKQPVRYKYEAPSPELCKHIRSVRISKAMLKWACWILTENEVDS